MAMKAKIYRDIDGSFVTKYAPPAIRKEVALRGFEQDKGRFTLLVFPCQRQDVILSGAVQRVLSGTNESEGLIAFGGCFTLEAIALLKERKVKIFVQSDFAWTDEQASQIQE